jgi:hypothetical protein
MPLFKLSGATGVTSVGLSAPSSIFTVTGSPVTSAGVLALALVAQAANTAWMGPATGGPADPTFRALVADDIPDLSGVYQPLSSKLSSFAALADSLGFLHNDGAGALTWASAGAGDFVGPGSSTDNAVVRFDGTTGKLGQNSLLIVDDSGNISSGGALPGSTAFYIERSGHSILTMASTGQDARMRMIRPDNSKSAIMEFIRGTTDEWYMGTPYTADTPDGSGNQFILNFYDGAVHTFLALSTAGVLSLPAYGAGTLVSDASGHISSSTAPSSGTVNSGTATQVAYYASTGTAVSSTPQFTVGASGNPAVTAGGTNQGIDLSPSGNGFVSVISGHTGGAGLAVKNTSTGIPTLELWTGGSNKNFLASVVSTDSIITGSTAGDFCMRSVGGNILFSSDNGGSAALKLVASTSQAIFSGAMRFSTFGAGYVVSDASGNLSIGGTQSANTVFAGPTTGSAAAPTFRALVAADFASIPATTFTMATARILGRTTAGTGVVEELSAGASLTLSTGSLNTVQDIQTSASPTWVSVTTTSDSNFNGVKVGRGAGNVSTNTAVGLNVLNANTTGASNTGLGVAALTSNTTGVQNVALGRQALNSNTEGNDNMAIGRACMQSNTKSSKNTAVGTTALQNHNLTTAGDGLNTVVGYATGLGITTGTGNTILGANVAGLAAGLTDNIIFSIGSGAIKLQFDATNWTMAGGLTVGTYLMTAAPTGGAAQTWRLGNRTAGAAAQGGTVRVEINGAAVDLLTT